MAIAVSASIFAGSLWANLSVPFSRSMGITIDLITGGSPTDITELRGEWFIFSGWLVRLAGWLFVPSMVAVFLDEAKTSKDARERLRMELARLVAKRAPKATSFERRQITDRLVEKALSLVEEIKRQ